ncbi:Predicted NADH:flavin oxidoreductase/NADH oxidase [Desulfatibacillum aliphaticivorans]|uniref:Predicted NADH:flavin oxidoreductase/NADH oxidase n=1 Tax=Desulfatibacillum aliphaticivorans TaxID=218208 RepID=B8FFF3_DESAL|nr:FAD-dependent oxidoreductase [Desulfatibacillum aliphaticivorans]ACL04213.1 Predicted NADH:flavin oxidoreductase/NADH oxidase [Desulfatibacillum aliphaticivorans]
MDPLFQPIKINQMEVKNRIYLPAMHLNMAVDFLVTDQIVDFYAERAKGGAGMIAVGNATVNEVAGNSMYIGAHKDEFMPGLTRLSKAIQDGGSRSVVQLNHAGRYSHSFMMNGKMPVAPSAIPSRMTRETPEALTLEGIKQTIVDFAESAERVKKCGYDAVEVLSGTGYLISEFLSPVTNARDDEYGGSFENRIRFGVEIMKAIREKVGPDYPVMVRLDNNDFMEGGQRADELTEYARILAEECGVDALCVKGNWHEARVPQMTTNVPRGTYAYLAKNVKDVVDVPVIASHRIHSPEVARQIIRDGFCDMVAFGRALIADPYMPEKARTGRENEIVQCIACCQGCFDSLFQLQHVKCMCNPKAGYESSKAIEKTASPKKVMIIGGGPAGMTAALAAKEKGHDVTLYEKSGKLGGQLYLAGAPHGREEFVELAKDLTTQLKLAKVDVKLNTAVDEALIDQEKPDVVLLATGAEPITPPIPGVDQPHVVQAWDVLLDKVSVGKKVVVIGGGAVGVETAMHLSEIGTLSGDAIKFLLVNQAETPETLYKLATQGTVDVTLIEMLDKIGAGIGKSTKWVMHQDMGRQRIAISTGTKALEISPTEIKVQTGEEVYAIPADTVVLAAGAKPVNGLAETLKAKGIDFQVIGDANGIALAFDAVHNGFDAGRNI